MTCMSCGYFDLAQTYSKAGQPDSALAYYERYVSPRAMRVECSAMRIISRRAINGWASCTRRRAIASAHSSTTRSSIDLWKNADPELQPIVKDVEAASGETERGALVMQELTDRLQAALGDSYRIERELGGGGMSHVYVARETALGRQVVIKVLPPEMSAAVNIERFRREIQLVASLQHPHIVTVHSAGQAGDLLYYTMPLVEGESLRARLARDGALSAYETVRILSDVADALAYAHSRGVVHRDIKPDNVLIFRNHAMVTDFGVAKAMSDASGSSALTSLGVSLGTPAYMSPEQVAADPNADHRADLYALGAMAYEMLCGHAPFTGMSPQQVLAAHIMATPPSLISQARGCAARRERARDALPGEEAGGSLPERGRSPGAATIVGDAERRHDAHERDSSVGFRLWRRGGDQARASDARGAAVRGRVDCGARGGIRAASEIGPSRLGVRRRCRAACHRTADHARDRTQGA